MPDPSVPPIVKALRVSKSGDLSQKKPHPRWQIPCLVLGSAPNPRLPEKREDPYNLICVNSSGWSARQLGLGRPQLTILGGFKLTKAGREKDREALEGLKTKTLVLINHLMELSIEEAPARLLELGYHYKRLKVIDYENRARLICKVTGKELGRGPNETNKVSNGLFAVCLAFYMGASEVIMSGISFSSDGLNYTNVPRHRRHILPDQMAITAIRERGLRIKTSEPDLALKTGIELV